MGVNLGISDGYAYCAHILQFRLRHVSHFNNVSQIVLKTYNYL